MNAADVEAALANYHKTAFTAWDRDNALWTALVAIEELNALVAWSGRQTWPEGKAPKVPEMEAVYRKLLDLDVRIALAWDTDNTDVDLHVLEPDGEEAFYRHQRTSTGGLVSHDVTTGYGPEEYLKKNAAKGAYKVLANYFGSRQQTLLGPVETSLFLLGVLVTKSCPTLCNPTDHNQTPSPVNSAGNISLPSRCVSH